MRLLDLRLCQLPVDLGDALKCKLPPVRFLQSGKATPTGRKRWIKALGFRVAAL